MTLRPTTSMPTTFKYVSTGWIKNNYKYLFPSHTVYSHTCIVTMKVYSGMIAHWLLYNLDCALMQSGPQFQYNLYLRCVLLESFVCQTTYRWSDFTLSINKEGRNSWTWIKPAIAGSSLRYRRIFNAANFCPRLLVSSRFTNFELLYL